MPSVFEISNSGMCNRKCAFCPRSDPNYEHNNEFIEEKMYKKILLLIEKKEIYESK